MITAFQRSCNKYAIKAMYNIKTKDKKWITYIPF